MSINPQQRTNPFPGLRPFRSDEHHLFFGREEQTAALLQLLRQNRFLAVVGTSGSGKSSLVRAGMIAELHGGTMTQAGSAWEVMILRPGGSPIENLARAMVEADLYDAEDPSTLPRLKATLSRSRFGLVEAMKQSDVFEPGTNLLVVVDQFEELFRFRQSGIESEEAAAAFVNLLLTASEQAECPIYVTITMRSDYLGDCSEIPGLAEAVNEGEYLIPRLLRDQKRDAIEKPIGVGGAKISPLLVQRLLNDVGDDPDQLPVLQHALMRMWEVWSAGSDRDRPLVLSDFEATGGLASALSNHADEIFDSLPDDRHRGACEKIFQTLTEKGDDNRGIRRPTRLAHLCAVADADRNTVITVLDAYRCAGVTFLMPGMETELSDRTVIDLSHESLMRGWQRLRSWVEDEAQSARIFRRVLDTAWLWRDGKAGLFRDPDLQIALSWRAEEQPNAQWAAQYGGHFETAIGFLESSNADAEAERQAKESARQRELQQAQQLAEAERQRASEQARAAVRLRWLVRGLGVVAVVALLATVVAWFARQEARSSAEVAARKAVDAEQQREIAQNALVDVAAAKELAERNLKSAEVAQAEAIEAEKRSREFRYATDMQLAATLVADQTANAVQIAARLDDHDPQVNKELEGKSDLRGFEWHYLKRLLDNRATAIDGFEKEVAGAAINADGELVTLSKVGLVQHWDLVTRQETAPSLDVTKGRSPISGALSPDGRQVALGIGDKVHLFDATTGAENPRTIAAKSRCGVIFSPDSSMLITVDTGAGWWDTSSGKPIAVDDFKLAAYGAGYHPLSVSADGLTVAVGGQGNYRGSFSVFQMNPETRGVTRLVDNAGGNGTKRALAISPDGETVAVSLYFAGAIYLFETSTGKQLRVHRSAHSASISAIAFDPEGTRMVTAAMDGSVKIWEDYKQIDSTDSTALVGHAQQVDTLTWTADGKQLLSAGKDKSVRLWNLEQDSDSIHREIAGAFGYRARYSPDGTLMAVAGENDAIRLRDSETGKVVARLPRDDSQLGSDSVVFSPNNRLLAAGFGGGNDVSFIELWDIDQRERLAVLPGSTEIPGFTTSAHTGLASGLTFSADGKQLVAGFGSLQMLGGGDQGNHPLLVYDVAGRKVIRRLEGHRNACVSVTFSEDNSRLASASYDGTARIWDTATWKELHVLENPDAATDRGNRRVTDVAFAPDGKRLAMASAEGNVIIWDAETGQHLKTLRGHSNEVWSVAFSPSGRTLASGSWDGTVRLWNVATWRELARLESGRDFRSMSLAFSPDGSRLLAAGGNAVFWSVEPTGDDPVLTPERLSPWLEPRSDLASRIRLLSEHPQLQQTLEKLSSKHPDNQAIQAALAATAANRHALQQDWEQATDYFDRLKIHDPAATDRWLRTPGLLRLATALLHQDRPVDAAMLLTGGEQRRGDDGNGTRVKRMGFTYVPGEYPLKLTWVDRGSPAWQVGLRAADIILKFNDVELTEETYAEFAKQITDIAVALTFQRPGQEQPETIELTQASYIQDDLTVELIEMLQASVEQKLAESASDPGLLELRAEIAGQSSNYEQQVADYTAAIESLSERPVDETAADLARLYRRRGSAYVGLKQWHPAAEDFAKGITDETTDDDLLASQALAQAEVLLDSLTAGDALVLVDMKSQGGATLTQQDDGSILASGENPDRDVYTLVFRTKLERISVIRLEAIPDPSLPGGGSGRSLSGGGNFHLNELRVVSAGNPVTLTNAVATFQERNPEGDIVSHAIDGKVDDRRGWSVNGGQGQPQMLTASLELVRAVGDELKIELHLSTAKWPKNNLGRFRLSVTDNPDAQEDSQALLAARQLTDPWQKLAAAHRINDDQQAINELVERQPRTAGAIGDLFIESENKDWQRAVEIYSKGITPETTDEELLARRAKAYEQLQDWQAAAADWKRAAGDKPQDANLLAEFAERLLNAEQFDLATEQRHRARRILEATFDADPGDDPAIDALAELLLDMSEPVTEWGSLKAAELKTTGGATLTPQDDNSLVIERKPHVLTLADPGYALQAIRIETSPDAAPPVGGTLAYTEYRILSTTLPSEGFRGRYVRVDLPGDNDDFLRSEDEKKILNLAEVQVFRGDDNIALQKTARQFGIYQDQSADRAVDGNTSGSPADKSIAHSGPSADRNQPWWEVDLGAESDFDRLVIWNSEDRIASRLSYFRVQVLDASRHIVYERFVKDVPRPSMQITRQVHLARVDIGAANGTGAWQLSFNSLRDISDSRRLGLSVTDQQAAPVPVDAIDTLELNWTASEPSNVAATTGTILAVQKDGSFVETTHDDELTLPVLADTIKAIRVETAGTSAAGKIATPTFNEYRVEAVNVSWSESGSPLGRYVRIDLPGDNSKFPRKGSDGETKTLNLAECQVFSGDKNVALQKTARQSSDYLDFNAARAVDGDTAGVSAGNRFAHTSLNDSEPWWEVDLKHEQPIDRFVVWNRTEVAEVPRMSHFRVRILNATRQVVFEQVIDDAPNPSREIDCRSLFTAKTPATDADTPPWTLRLGKDSGVSPSGRFRISSTQEQLSLEQEEAISEARKILQPVARLAAAYDFNSSTVSSADWFRRALDDTDSDSQRTLILTHLQDHPQPLAELLKQSPDDIDLQLALARSHVKAGQQHLTSERPTESLAEFQPAVSIFTRLLNQTFEPTWTVLKPMEMTTETSAQLHLQSDDSLLIQKPDGNDTFSVTFETRLQGITGLRLETLADPRLPGGGPGTNGDGNFVLSEISLQAAPGDQSEPARSIRLVKAAADFSQANKDNNVSNSIDGSEVTGWAIHPQLRQDHVAVFATAEKVGDGEPLRLTVRLAHQSITEQLLVGRFRVSVTTDSDPATKSKLRFKLTHSELASLDVSIGQALAQQNKPAQAAAAFARALDRVAKDDERKQLIAQIQEYPTALTILTEQRPQDTRLQLALAKSLAESGKKALADDRQEEALPQLASAGELFAKLAADHAETQWIVLEPSEMTSDGGATLTKLADNSILASGTNPEKDVYEFEAQVDAGSLTAIRLEGLTHPSLEKGSHGRSLGNGKVVLTEFEAEVASADTPDTWQPIQFADSWTNHPDFSRDFAMAIDGDLTTGWTIDHKGVPLDRMAVFTALAPFGNKSGTRLRFRLRHESEYGQHAFGRVRLSVTDNPSAIEVAKFQQDLTASGLADLRISLGNAHGRQAQVDDSAAAFSEALDLATDREARTKVPHEASAYQGVLDKLSELRRDDASFFDALARHHQTIGEFTAARAAAATARALYEQQLAAKSSNSHIAGELANLLIDISPIKWTPLQPEEMKSAGGAELKRLDDNSILASGVNPDRDVYTIVTRPELEHITGLRLEALHDDSLPQKGPGRAPDYGNFHLNELTVHAGGSVVKLSDAVATFQEANAEGDEAKHAIDGQLDSRRGWSVFGNQREANSLTASLLLDRAAAEELKIELHFSLSRWKKHNLGRFRLSLTDSPILLGYEQQWLATKSMSSPWSRLGAAYLAVGEFDKALDMFARSIELTSGLAARAAAAQEAAAFQKIFEKLQERFPDDQSLRLGQAKYLATRRIAESRFQSAVDLLSGILADFPDDIELLNQRAGAYMKLADWQAADADYARVVELEIDDGRRRAAERARAECGLRLGQFQQSADVYFQEMLLSPGDYHRLRDTCTTLMLARQPGMEKLAAGRLFQAFKDTGNAGQAEWLVRAFTVQPGLVTNDKRQQLLKLAKTAGDPWTAPMTAAIHYRLGDLKQAEPLLTASKGKPQFEALAAMLLYDQGKTNEARSLLKTGCEAWFARERAKDPASAVPAQQRFQEWGVQIAVWREAARKLIGPRIVELDGEVYGGLTLEIVNASYGVGDLKKDVTETLRQHFSTGGTLSWGPLTYRQVFGPDPAPNKYKHLTVTFRLNDVEGEVALSEDEPIHFLAFAKDVLKQGPTNTAALLERAGLLADAGLSEEALEDLERLVALKVDSIEVHALHGRVLAGLRRDDEALTYLNQAIEAGSQDGAVFAARGAILLRQGQSDPARADLEKSLELKPTELAARTLADLLLDDAEKATTWTVLTPTEMKSEGGATLTLLEDDSVLSSGKHPDRDVYTVTAPLDVESVSAIALELLPHESFVGGSVGRGTFGQTMITELEVARGDQSGDQRPVALSGAIADVEQQGEWGLYGAANAIDGQTDDKAWGVGPNFQDPHRLLVKLDQPITNGATSLTLVIRQDHFNDAHPQGLLLGRFRLAVTDDPAAFEREQSRYAALKVSEPWSRLAGAYLALGDHGSLDKLLARHPAVAVGIGDMYAVARDWPRAIAQYSKSITAQSSDAELLAKRADAYLASEQWELADADWKRIFDLNPSDQSWRQRWVTALTATKRWSQLADHYNEIIDGLREGRASHQPRYKVLETLIRRKDGVFAALRSIRPNDSLLQISLARDSVLRSDWDEAAAAYLPGLDDAATPDERYEYAAALLLAGHSDKYHDILKRIVEPEFENRAGTDAPYALARMATMSPEQNVPWSRVIQWGETAAKEDKGWYTHVAGMAQLRGGHFDQALEWFDKSVASGWHPELNQLALCLLHAKSGDNKKAREYLNQAEQWLKEAESNKVDGYYKAQATDWLEFNVLYSEATSLLHVAASQDN